MEDLEKYFCTKEGDYLFVKGVPIAIHNVNDCIFKKLNIPLCPTEECVLLCWDSHLFD